MARTQTLFGENTAAQFTQRARKTTHEGTPTNKLSRLYAPLRVSVLCAPNDADRHAINERDRCPRPSRGRARRCEGWEGCFPDKLPLPECAGSPIASRAASA